MTDAPAWEGLKLAGGRFEVQAQLGTGGMGLVWLAHDHHLDCDVVIKAPRPEVFTGSAIARFTREIRSLVRLHHPHIVKILDVGEHDNLPFVVLHYLAGGSLRSRQQHNHDQTPRPMPFESLCDWLEPIASALDFIHEQGYVHRDVKPDNILFDPHGHAYLADFGVAKLLSADEGGYNVTSVTAAGAVVGTPFYMAPELVEDRAFDGRADQYALAVTIHELLAGQVPFDGAYRAAVLMAHTTLEPPLLSDVVPAIPRRLALAVKQALAKKVEDRHLDCGSFAGVVLEALADAGAGRVRIPVPGWWYARPESDPEAESEAAVTPATVTLSPGELYRLMARDTVTDQQLGSLGRLAGSTNLDSLTLSGCIRLSDAGLRQLSGLVRLQSLSLDETRVTDDGLAVLDSFPNLKELNLGKCPQISDRGLAHVAARTSLQKLFLAECAGITDAGFARLKPLAGLCVLDASSTSITDAGLAHLEKLSGLRKLILGGCQRITDAGVVHLSGLVQLGFLTLDGTAITDTGVRQLVKLTGLQGLDVRRCRGVTSAGVAALRTALRGCRVSGP